METFVNNNKFNLKFNMAGIHNFLPGNFSGASDECVLEFFENFNLIARASNWNENNKLLYLPLYLKGAAFKAFKIFNSNNQEVTFVDIENKLKEDFTSHARSKMLKSKLRNRRLRSSETIAEFWFDMLFLIQETNPQICESDKIEIILEALSLEYYNIISIMNNDTLSDLEKNLKKNRIFEIS